MQLKNKTIKFALTNSFYAFEKTIIEISKLIKEGVEIIPIMSFNNLNTDENVIKFTKKIENITEKKVITSVKEIENAKSDAMIIAPCNRRLYSKTCTFNNR